MPQRRGVPEVIERANEFAQGLGSFVIVYGGGALVLIGAWLIWGLYKK